MKHPDRPDIKSLLAPLKGFQRKTVDYAFRRMYLDDQPAHRFLVADEVGLGKTLIARGIIARAVDHLWDSVDRIDVVYICTNQAIVRQNLDKLTIAQAADHSLATRLTLLPRELSGLAEHKLNFVSFTPATSFDLRSRGGRFDERVVLYWLIRDSLGKSSGLRNLLQMNRGWDVWQKDIKRRPELDDSLRQAFARALAAPERAELRAELDELCQRFYRWRDNWPYDLRVQRVRLVGKLRALLAATCVDALQPDFIVLDEFQRFRHILHGDDEMSELARTLWTYAAPEGHRARVLLLSATPYRMYSTDSEVGGDDHYPDFIATMRFLMDDDDERVTAFTGKLRSYRRALHAALQGDAAAVAVARDAVQHELRQFMVRTERVATTADREGMIREPECPAPLSPADLEQFLCADEVARALGHPAPVEYWKSAPYLLNFMSGYKLKSELVDRAGDPDVVAAISRHRRALLSRPAIRDYRAVDPGNARLRALMRELVDGGQWQLLWVPPSLSYWPLGAPFAGHASFTKALVFSAWNVVPDVVSAMLSYEAERRALAAAGALGDLTYRNLYRKHGRRLAFSHSRDRLGGMPVLALQYPSLVLADEISPLALAAAGAADVRDAAARRVAELLAELPEGEGHDESWYWAAPALLDQRRSPARFLAEWTLTRPGSSDADGFDGDEASGDDSHFDEHVRRLERVLSGDEPLGRKPDDLVDVITDMALGAPGILAARALAPLGIDDHTRRRAAVLVAEGFRSLFNQPVAAAVVGGVAPDVPYWRATLHYAIAGGLQAVLDEYMHQLCDERAWKGESASDMALGIARAMGHAASIKTSRVHADTLRAKGGEVLVRALRLRASFALRYGRIVGDQSELIARESAVRSAFNSPFRPFVLASTSIGQEGLDFHPWCHAIYHWNLPGNPVDLEQREGRVHRYKGHAIRKNVAALHGRSALSERWRAGDDVWDVLFDGAARARAEGASDLVPWWICEGPCHVERRILALPYSKEHDSLARLKRDLVAYRLVFGQPRQQELLSLVQQADLDAADLAQWVLDLRP